MDLLQRYTTDDFYYELEEKFLETLEELPVKYSSSIISQLDKAVIDIIENPHQKISKNKYGTLAGVVREDQPLYFSINYLNFKNKYPVFYQLNIIDSDDYLDYINQIKLETHEDRTNKTLTRAGVGDNT